MCRDFNLMKEKARVQVTGSQESLVQITNLALAQLTNSVKQRATFVCVCVCACVHMHVHVCCGGGTRLEALRSMELKFSFSLMCGVKKKITFIPCFHPLLTWPISDFFAFLPDIYIYSSSLSSHLLSLFLSIWTLSLPSSHGLVQWVSANSLCKLTHILFQINSILGTTRKKSLKDFFKY